MEISALMWLFEQVAAAITIDNVLRSVTLGSAAAIVVILLTTTERGKQFLIAVDQGLNVLFGSGYADETLSSYFFRRADWRERAVNALFWWQKDASGKRNHCQRSYISEMSRRHLPPEFRGIQFTKETSQ